MKNLIAVLMLMFATSVMAMGPPPFQGGGSNTNINANINGNRNNNSNRNSVRSKVKVVNTNEIESSQRLTSKNYNSIDSGSNTQAINVEASDLSKLAPAVVSSSLTTSNGTCMGSSSASGSGAGFGLGVATTWTDEECSARYNSSQMKALGLNSVAVELMCDIEAVYKARKRVGKACVKQARYEPVVKKAVSPVSIWTIPITHSTVEEDLR